MSFFKETQFQYSLYLPQRSTAHTHHRGKWSELSFTLGAVRFYQTKSRWSLLISDATPGRQCVNPVRFLKAAEFRPAHVTWRTCHLLCQKAWRWPRMVASGCAMPRAGLHRLLPGGSSAAAESAAPPVSRWEEKGRLCLPAAMPAVSLEPIPPHSSRLLPSRRCPKTV